jgi:hypothetical protein
MEELARLRHANLFQIKIIGLESKFKNLIRKEQLSKFTNRSLLSLRLFRFKSKHSIVQEVTPK